MEGDTLVSKNLLNHFQSRQDFPNETKQITDTLPKQEYYKKLTSSSEYIGGSQSTIINTDLKSTKSSSKLAINDYKPSGKELSCLVLMLEGIEKSFNVDRNALGRHLFKDICEHLDLIETEYFGLTFQDGLHTDTWLKENEKISKQLDKSAWKFEFRVKFYPAYPDCLKYDLTRYFLCLQLRQDLISGQLPCSFNTYVILGAYVIQSEAGDYDANVHNGIGYLFNVPLSPKDVQTPELLLQICELHKQLFGQSPEQADRLFLENARKLALYGVDLHRVTNEVGEDISLGIYNSGILVYRGRLRMQRYSWTRIVKLSYIKKSFIMVVRPPILNTSTEIGKRNSRSMSLSNMNSLRRSISSKPPNIKQQTLVFKCANSKLAKRLYGVVVDQHAFFRLREVNQSKRTNLLLNFDTRTYTYHSQNRKLTNQNGTHNNKFAQNGTLIPSQSDFKRVVAQRKPLSYNTNLVTLNTPQLTRKGKFDTLQSSKTEVFAAPFAKPDDSPDSFKNKPSITITSFVKPNNLKTVNTSSLNEVSSIVESPIIWNPAYVDKSNMPIKQSERPVLGKEHWQMTPADCTQGLGMDPYGTDVATMFETGWQGCRTNRGVKGIGAYFYEATVLENGDVRVGWSTNDASLMLGSDSKGFGYGADEIGLGSQRSETNRGRFIHDGQSFEMGIPAAPNDVISCFLEIREQPGNTNTLEGQLMWAHNGIIISSSILPSIDSSLASNYGFFPSTSLRDSRLILNFGDQPFTYSPIILTGGSTKWQFIDKTPQSNIVLNVNAGWRINQFDITSSTDLEISEDGRMIQTTTSDKWQGFRANKGVYQAGKYYYEVEQVESSGFCRFGWAFADGSLLVGNDDRGYSFGSISVGNFGKMFNKNLENYGHSFKAGDVIGCFLDLDEGNMFWSVNGKCLPQAYSIDHSIIRDAESIFFPAASLLSTTLKVNYGDRRFQFPPQEEWFPLFAASDDFIKDSDKWPSDINFFYSQATSTDRVETEIIKPDTTITIAEESNLQSIPMSRNSETSEDTVIMRTSEVEFAAQQSSCHEHALTNPNLNKKAFDEEKDNELTENGERLSKNSNLNNKAFDEELTLTEDERLTQAISEMIKLDSETIVVGGDIPIQSDPYKQGQ